MYGCDCDGVERKPVDRGAHGDAARGVLRAIDRVTGHEPPTCPWRAMSEPIVRDVLAVSWAAEGNLAAVLGADPDHKLTQALGVYTRAKNYTRSDEMRLESEEREREKTRRQAMNNARGPRG